MAKERPATLDNISGRRLTDDEVSYLFAMVERDGWLMERIRNGYPQDERSEVGRRFLELARSHAPDLSLAHAAEALGSMVIKARGLR